MLSSCSSSCLSAVVDADEEKGFSLRDYVFRSRSKDLRTNWPFGPQSLDFCLKQGVQDLLPPFEPRDLVKKNDLLTAPQPEKPAAELAEVELVEPNATTLVSSVGDSNVGIRCPSRLPVDKLVSGCSHQRRNSDELAHTDTGDQSSLVASCSNDQTEKVLGHMNEGPSSVTVNWSLAEEPSKECAKPVRLSPQKLQGPVEKKRRLVVKFSSSLNPSRAEDLASNSNAGSDAMGSKICPVCKIFSSTSNTTLNAHIDQCLFTEPDTKQLVTRQVVKPKVILRKKRLMVDIYASAPHCTLEDLDRRNGTTWALELASTARTNEECSGRQSLQQIAPEYRDKESEGAVYVDSNGIKIRILSKFNESLPLMSVDEPKLDAAHKVSKSILISKMKHFGPKLLKKKKKKLKAQGRKLGSSKILRTRIKAQQEGNTVTHQKQKSLPELPESLDHSISAVPQTPKLVCSKHSDDSKELNQKDATLESMLLVTRSLAARNQTGSGDYPVNGETSKTSTSSEEKGTPLEATGADFLSEMVQTVDNEKKKISKPNVSLVKWSLKPESALSGRPPKPSRISGSLTLFPHGKMGKNSTEMAHNSGNAEMRLGPSASHMLTESQTNSLLRKNIEATSQSISLVSKRGDSMKKNPLVKIHQHESLVNCSEYGESSSSVIQGTQAASIRHHIGDTGCAKKKARTPKRNISERFLWSKTGHIVDPVYPSHGDTLESEQRQLHSKSRERENVISTSSPPVDRCRDTETAMQTRISGSECSMTVYSSDNVVADQLSTESINSENKKSLHLPSLTATEADYEPVVQESSHDKLMCHVHVSCDNDTVKFRRKKGPSRPPVSCSESQADLGSPTQESGACLDSSKVANIKITQGRSLITSITKLMNDGQNSGIVRELSEPQASTASTMPFPSPMDIGLNKLEPENRNGESENQEAKRVSQAKQDEKFSCAKPNSCSCRESHSGESQFIRQSTVVTDGSVATSRERLVPRLYVAPRAASSFGASRHSSRINMMVNSGLESPTQSVSSKASSEYAANAQASIGASSFLRPSLQVQIPSSSNPVLRLMGKNLMVVNSEEIGQLETPTSDYPIRFAPLNIVFKQDSQHNNLGGSTVVSNQPPSPAYHHQVLRPDIQQPCFAPFHNGQNSLQNQVHRWPAPVPQACGRLKDVVCGRLKDVVVIDDLPETMKVASRVGLISDAVSPRPFSCFAPQNQFLPRDVPAGARPMFPILYPAINTSAESPFRGPRPFMLNPLVMPPPASHLSRPVYHSQTLH